MMSLSTGGGKYCPISPAQVSSMGCNFQRSISGRSRSSFSGNHCPVPSQSDSMERPGSATHGLKRRLSEVDSGSEDDSVDSGSSSFKKKKPRNRYPFMEKGVDAATRRRAIMAPRANYMGGFLVNKKKKEDTPIATLAKDSSDQLSKLKDLMLRWGKLEQAQSQLDRDRAKLIQDHAQLLASWRS